jgi:hypothetical protein
MTDSNSIRESQPFRRPEAQLPLHLVSMRELRAEPHRYLAIPEFQRGEVWTRRERWQLIESILEGESISQFLGYQTLDENGVSYWHLVDGVQRLVTILRFMSGGFKTWTAAQKARIEPGSPPPIEGGRFFEQMSPQALNYFLEYRIAIAPVRDTSAMALATLFRRVQNQEKLTAAERYSSYISAAKDAARQIECHIFWEDFYDGHRGRGQCFQSSLHLVGLAAAHPHRYAELHGSRYLYDLVSGCYDERITDGLITGILASLDQMMLLYYGAHFTQRSWIVPMYQSVHYLDDYGYQPGERDRGRLCDWLTHQTEEGRGTKPNYASRIQLLLRASYQEEFWAQQLPQVLALFGISPPGTTARAADVTGGGGEQRRDTLMIVTSDVLYSRRVSLRSLSNLPVLCSQQRTACLIGQSPLVVRFLPFVSAFSLCTHLPHNLQIASHHGHGRGFHLCTHVSLLRIEQVVDDLQEFSIGPGIES